MKAPETAPRRSGRRAYRLRRASRKHSARWSATEPAQCSVPPYPEVLAAGAVRRTGGHLISGHARIRVYPVSAFEMSDRQQPTWRAAPLAAQGGVEQNACYGASRRHAAARRFAVRRPAGVVRESPSRRAPCGGGMSQPLDFADNRVATPNQGHASPRHEHDLSAELRVGAKVDGYRMDIGPTIFRNAVDQSNWHRDFL
jgi:hypothetical protein